MIVKWSGKLLSVDVFSHTHTHVSRQMLRGGSICLEDFLLLSFFHTFHVDFLKGVSAEAASSPGKHSLCRWHVTCCGEWNSSTGFISYILLGDNGPSSNTLDQSVFSTLNPVGLEAQRLPKGQVGDQWWFAEERCDCLQLIVDSREKVFRLS